MQAHEKCAHAVWHGWVFVCCYCCCSSVCICECQPFAGDIMRKLHSIILIPHQLTHNWSDCGTRDALEFSEILLWLRACMRRYGGKYWQQQTFLRNYFIALFTRTNRSINKTSLLNSIIDITTESRTIPSKPKTFVCIFKLNLICNQTMAYSIQIILFLILFVPLYIQPTSLNLFSNSRWYSSDTSYESPCMPNSNELYNYWSNIILWIPHRIAIISMTINWRVEREFLNCYAYRNEKLGHYPLNKIYGAMKMFIWWKSQTKDIRTKNEWIKKKGKYRSIL